MSEAVKILKGEYVIQALEEHKMDKALIFCRTKIDCDNLEKYLQQRGGGIHKLIPTHTNTNTTHYKLQWNNCTLMFFFFLGGGGHCWINCISLVRSENCLGSITPHQLTLTDVQQVADCSIFCMCSYDNLVLVFLFVQCPMKSDGVCSIWQKLVQNFEQIPLTYVPM